MPEPPAASAGGGARRRKGGGAAARGGSRRGAQKQQRQQQEDFALSLYAIASTTLPSTSLVTASTAAKRSKPRMLLDLVRRTAMGAAAAGAGGAEPLHRGRSSAASAQEASAAMRHLLRRFQSSKPTLSVKEARALVCGDAKLKRPGLVQLAGLQTTDPEVSHVALLFLEYAMLSDDVLPATAHACMDAFVSLGLERIAADLHLDSHAVREETRPAAFNIVRGVAGDSGEKARLLLRNDRAAVDLYAAFLRRDEASTDASAAEEPDLGPKTWDDVGSLADEDSEAEEEDDDADSSSLPLRANNANAARKPGRRPGSAAGSTDATFLGSGGSLPGSSPRPSGLGVGGGVGGGVGMRAGTSPFDAAAAGAGGPTGRAAPTVKEILESRYARASRADLSRVVAQIAKERSSRDAMRERLIRERLGDIIRCREAVEDVRAANPTAQIAKATESLGAAKAFADRVVAPVVSRRAASLTAERAAAAAAHLSYLSQLPGEMEAVCASGDLARAVELAVRFARARERPESGFVTPEMEPLLAAVSEAYERAVATVVARLEGLHDDALKEAWMAELRPRVAASTLARAVTTPVEPAAAVAEAAEAMARGLVRTLSSSSGGAAPPGGGAAAGAGAAGTEGGARVDWSTHVARVKGASLRVAQAVAGATAQTHRWPVPNPALGPNAAVEAELKVLRGAVEAYGDVVAEGARACAAEGALAAFVAALLDHVPPRLPRATAAVLDVHTACEALWSPSAASGEGSGSGSARADGEGGSGPGSGAPTPPSTTGRETEDEDPASRSPPLTSAVVSALAMVCQAARRGAEPGLLSAAREMSARVLRSVSAELLASLELMGRSLALMDVELVAPVHASSGGVGGGGGAAGRSGGSGAGGAAAKLGAGGPASPRFGAQAPMRDEAVQPTSPLVQVMLRKIQDAYRVADALALPGLDADAFPVLSAARQLGVALGRAAEQVRLKQRDVARGFLALAANCHALRTHVDFLSRGSVEVGADLRGQLERLESALAGQYLKATAVVVGAAVSDALLGPADAGPGAARLPLASATGEPDGTPSPAVLGVLGMIASYRADCADAIGGVLAGKLVAGLARTVASATAGALGLGAAAPASPRRDDAGVAEQREREQREREQQRDARYWGQVYVDASFAFAMLPPLPSAEDEFVRQVQARALAGCADAGDLRSLVASRREEVMARHGALVAALKVG